MTTPCSSPPLSWSFGRITPAMQAANPDANGAFHLMQYPEAKITPVILSGGSGTRLWPMSRQKKPKQLLSLTEERMMFQLTALRFQDGAMFEPPIVVANAAHADMISAQLAEVGCSSPAILLEPFGRNTAPAIALAAMVAAPSATLLVMPSDHVIADLAAFIWSLHGPFPWWTRAGSSLSASSPTLRKPAAGEGHCFTPSRCQTGRRFR